MPNADHPHLGNPFVAPTDLAALDPEAEQFAAALADLQALHRSHALVHALTVGKTLLQRFFSGSSHGYQDHAGNKQHSFNRFAAVHQAELADMGHSADYLRRCIRAHIVVLTLPPPVQDKLLFGQLVALSECPDPTARARLALTAVAEGWHMGDLSHAVARVKAGTWYDTEPLQPGVQPPPEPAPPPLQPGEAGVLARLPPARLVTRGEKVALSLRNWSAAMLKVDAGQLDAGQKKRALEAVVAAERELAAVKKALKG
jgi:hypothetical protein